MTTESINAALATYKITDAELAQMREKFLPLVIQSPEDKAGAARVREARLTVKNTRVFVEKTRKALKEDALRYGQAVDAEARRITAELVPIEEHLEAQEQAIAAEVARRAQAIENARREKLRLRMEALAANRSTLLPLDVEAMSDEQFDAELARSATEYQAAQERERAEAEAREHARLAEEARIAAVRAEQERIAAEQKAEADRLAADRAKMEAEQRAEQERIAAAQRKLDDERAALARAEELRLAAERAAQAERDRIAREEQARADAAAKAEADRQRRDAARPIAEKIEAFAAALHAVPLPDVPQRVELVRIVTAAAEQVRAIAGGLVR